MSRYSIFLKAFTVEDKSHCRAKEIYMSMHKFGRLLDLDVKN